VEVPVIREEFHPGAAVPSAGSPRVVIEMGGPNVVIRATSHVDRAYTASLADVLNAASSTHTCVVIDPEPIRCDDGFATYDAEGPHEPCADHRSCRPVEAEVAGTGIVRIPAERTVWLIDVRRGTFCRVDRGTNPRFIAAEAWSPVVAVCVTPRRLIALGLDGVLISAERAHRPIGDGDRPTHTEAP
jgi:hypothetical protein